MGISTLSKAASTKLTHAAARTHTHTLHACMHTHTQTCLLTRSLSQMATQKTSTPFLSISLSLSPSLSLTKTHNALENIHAFVFTDTVPYMRIHGSNSAQTLQF